jgi:uncharacterized protein YbaR (Trm112 family)
MARHFPIVCKISTVYSLPKSILYTWLFCSSGVNIGNVISSAQTPWARCRVWVPIHPTIPSLLTFWFNCPAFTNQGSLLCFARFLATLACPATRPPMQHPKRPLCTEPLLLVDLSAVMFAPLFITLFYPYGKTRGLILRIRNCAWWSHPCRPDIPPLCRQERGGHTHTPTARSHPPNTW